MNKGFLKDLSKRLVASSIAIAIVAVLIYFANINLFKPFFALAVSAIASIAVLEYANMAQKKNIYLNKKILVIGSILFVLSFFVYSQIVAYRFLPFLVFFAVVLFSAVVHFKKVENGFAYLAFFAFGMLYVALPLGLIFPILYVDVDDGRLWLVYLIAITKITDIGAYFAGKLFGRHKLAKNLSPKKTVEGAVFGFICAIFLSYFFALLCKNHLNVYFNLRPMSSVLLGGFLGVFGQVGDLLESLFKRDVGIKDSSAIPAMGGILDMLDSLLINIPIMYLFLEAVV